MCQNVHLIHSESPFTHALPRNYHLVMSEVLPEGGGKKKKLLSSIDFMEEHLIIVSLRSYPQILVFAACKVNRDVWYGATNLTAAKLKQGSADGYEETGILMFVTIVCWEIIMGWTTSGRSCRCYGLCTPICSSYCYCTVIWGLASVPRYLCWQHKLLSGNISKYLNVILNLRKAQKKRKGGKS